MEVSDAYFLGLHAQHDGQAKAGTGKSTTILESIKRHSDQHKIMVIVFQKSNQKVSQWVFKIKTRRKELFGSNFFKKSQPFVGQDMADKLLKGGVRNAECRTAHSLAFWCSGFSF